MAIAHDEPQHCSTREMSVAVVGEESVAPSSTQPASPRTSPSHTQLDDIDGPDAASSTDLSPSHEEATSPVDDSDEEESEYNPNTGQSPHCPPLPRTAVRHRPAVLVSRRKPRKLTLACAASLQRRTRLPRSQ